MLQKLLPFYHFQRLSCATWSQWHVSLCCLGFFSLFDPAFPSLQKKNAWARTFHRRLPCFKFIKNILYKNGLKMFPVFLQTSRVLGLCAQSEHKEMWKCWAMQGSVGASDAVWLQYWICQSWEVVICQTMRWLCSAVVGCWSAVDSDKPSSSPPSSPAEEADESNERCARWRWRHRPRWHTHPAWSRCSRRLRSLPDMFLDLQWPCQRIQTQGRRSLNPSFLEGAERFLSSEDTKDWVQLMIDE